jgi:hypothetical protein
VLLRQLVPPFAVTAVLAAILWVLLAYVVDPTFWPPLSKPEQCECLVHDWLPGALPVYDPVAVARTIREPQNTWSNLAYLMVAAWVVVRYRDPAMRWTAAATVGLGLGSLLYHASGSRTLRHVDIAGMYWVYGMILFLAARQYAGEVRGRIMGSRSGAAFAVGTLVAAILATAYRNIRIFDFKPLHISIGTGVTAAVAAMLMFLICRHRRDPRSWRLLSSSLSLLGVGLVLQIGDRPGSWLCLPGATIQPHAMWHVASAACLAVATHLLVQPASFARAETPASRAASATDA